MIYLDENKAQVEALGDHAVINPNLLKRIQCLEYPTEYGSDFSGKATLTRCVVFPKFLTTSNTHPPPSPKNGAEISPI